MAVGAGETPLEEERQLDQLAEEDPFLAEALEGYRSHPEGRHANGRTVEGRLRERDRKQGLLFYLPAWRQRQFALAVMVGGFGISIKTAPSCRRLQWKKRRRKSADTALDEKKEEDAMLPAVREEDARPRHLYSKKNEVLPTNQPAPSVPTPLPKLRNTVRSSDVLPPAERQIARAELPAQTEDRSQPRRRMKYSRHRLDQKRNRRFTKEDTEEPNSICKPKPACSPAGAEDGIYALPAKPENRKSPVMC